MAARRYAVCAIRPIASASTSTRRDLSRDDRGTGHPRNARFPAIEAEGEPEHRSHGHGHETMLIRDVVSWARSIAADRVDPSATPAGQRIYEKPGFTVTSALRMQFVL
jgi:GNAT superfamily N-acetyltransferase